MSSSVRHTEHTEHTEQHACAPCPLAATRRTFLRNTLAQTGAALALMGISSDVVHALTSRRVPAMLTALADTGKGQDNPIKKYPLPSEDGVQIDRDNGVILVRWLKSVYAFSLRCPHQNTTLRWLDKDEHFQCPKHRSEYAADGDYMSGRATRGMDRYAIRLDGKTVIVDTAVLFDQSKDEKGWTSAAVSL
jgi:Rieske Fe-S protein